MDRAWQLGYIAAFALLRLWWFLAWPTTRGALVAVWHDGAVLLVRNSYRRGLTLPGGFRRPDEDPAAAGARELNEELGIDIPATALRPAWQGRQVIDFRLDLADVLEATPAARPAARPDNREVVWAGWLTPAEALAQELGPHTRGYLEARRRGWPDHAGDPDR